MSKSPNGWRMAGLSSLATAALVGGVLSAGGAANADAGFTFDRIGGQDRYETSTLVADEYGASDDVILANGQPGNYADALSGNYLSGVQDAPILLTKQGETPQSVQDQLEEMGTDSITLLGGTGVISEDQADELRSDGYTVNRISGDDRFATNADVIEAGGNADGGLGLVATGFDFPDALAGGAISYDGHPLGLSTQDDIDQDVIDALKASGVDRVQILGGRAAVSQDVADELEDNGITVEGRLAGANRAATSVDAANYAVDELGFTDEGVNVASGYVQGFGADALAGGPLTGQQQRPLLVTRNVDNPGDSVLGYLSDNADTLSDGTIFGGTAAVSADAQAEMEAAAQGTGDNGGGDNGGGDNGGGDNGGGDNGGGQQTASDAPELVNASVESQTADDVTVRYHFDEDVDGDAPDESLFHLYAFDSSEVTSGAASAVIDSGNSSDVLATFDVDQNAVETVTTATVDNAAVQDAQGDENPEADSGIQDVTFQGGTTSAPDLVEVRDFRSSNDTVEFVFDQAVDTAGAGSQFLLVPQDNNDPVLTGDTTETDGDEPNIVQVTFSSDGIEPDTEEMTARAVVRTDAATDADGDPNPRQSVDVNNGGNTDTPDLVSVTFDRDDDEARFEFDESVSQAVNNTFVAYDRQGGEMVADSVNRDESDTSVVVAQFGDDELDDAVGGSVNDNAVTSNTGTSADTNRVDEEAASDQTFAADRTTAPDLVSARVERSANGGNLRVTYSFDEPVASGPTAGSFFVTDGDGTRTAGTTATRSSEDPSEVFVTFGSDAAIENAVAATVDDGAVTDNNGGGGDDNIEGYTLITGLGG